VHFRILTFYDILSSTGYNVTNIVSFILIWVSTVLLLYHYSSRVGKAKYWLIVSIPLLYFIIQFQGVPQVQTIVGCSIREQEKCKPDQLGNCPSGFLSNGKGHCFPDKKCPKGFEKQNNDETGTCRPIEPPKDCEPSYPSLCIPKGSSDIDCPTLEKRGIHDFKVIGSDPHRFDGDNDGIGCEDGHHNSGGNGNGNGNSGNSGTKS
jgi:hypothetical protein